ncbi:secreted protein [Melampsora americana]|nr:secreted protein [Melampsora americana]
MNKFMITSFIIFSFTTLKISSLRITSPNQNETFFTNSSMLITWEAVPTDPLSFDIQLINQNSSVYPNGLTKHVKKSQAAYVGYFTISNLTCLISGSEYQILFLSMETSTILTQSPKFNIYNSNSSSSGPGYGTNGNSFNINNSSTSAYDQANKASKSLDQSLISFILFSVLLILFV